MVGKGKVRGIALFPKDFALFCTSQISCIALLISCKLGVRKGRHGSRNCVIFKA